MANLVRSAKSGSDWTDNDLDAYNIQIRFEDAATFFGTDNLPLPAVDEEILTTQEAEDMVHDNNAELINLLDLAMKPRSAEDSAVVDFAVQLFRQLGYAKRHRVARTRKDIPLFICGEWRHAKTDVCLVDRLHNDILLVVQEDKRFTPDDLCEPRAQLIYEVIAAFDYNNRLRQSAGEATVEFKIMPGIVLVGTTPTFYKIPVTESLVRDMHHGTYPTETTIVSAHVPTLSRPNRRYSEGMKPLDNRQAILRCCEGFKGVVGIQDLYSPEAISSCHTSIRDLPAKRMRRSMLGRA
ncbi:uncharacterized protein LAESUDRAFT_687714 [Laetiporus sulphureus 93-53]|uniref:Uncharacterized protein n=1 Tax=Laetiporus sulphureus 93-53 TaxID=1314785 RepID=A0A165BBL7_9APHY|nr:uncharacterized protein LAESUDRAFT_687714 [Laetiporus sulphureus 93-53]KZT00684.1 hypothetical protein LAESUDRAFT_687714 [Laetiporus sulphureus 93-53]